MCITKKTKMINKQKIEYYQNTNPKRNVEKKKEETLLKFDK